MARRECEERGATEGDVLASGQALGIYKINRSMIELDRDTSFWVDGNQSVENFAVFAHEYLHYLHNYSTVAGITYFITHVKLARLFINTVGPDGRSLGAHVLATDSRTEYLALMAWRRHLRGDGRLPTPATGDEADVRLTVTGTSAHHTRISFLGQVLKAEEARIAVRMQSERSPAEDGTVVLGYQILAEGLAFEMERLIYRGAGRDVSALDEETPEFPYLLPRMVFEFVAKRSLSAADMIKACVLALQSADCGATFVDLAGEFAKAPAGRSDESILDDLAAGVTTHLSANVDALFARMVDPELNAFHSRPLLGESIRYHQAQCRQYVERRTREPFFELELTAALHSDATKLVAFLERSPPCVFRHTSADGEEQEMFYIASQAWASTHLQALATFHAFGDYVTFHFGKVSLLPTSSIHPQTCCFHGSCRIAFAKDNPAICITAPWRSFSAQAGEGCWFAAGVAVARGRPSAHPESANEA